MTLEHKEAVQLLRGAMVQRAPGATSVTEVGVVTITAVVVDETVVVEALAQPFAVPAVIVELARVPFHLGRLAAAGHVAPVLTASVAPGRQIR